jgi:hypothetical protein
MFNKIKKKLVKKLFFINQNDINEFYKSKIFTENFTEKDKLKNKKKIFLDQKIGLIFYFLIFFLINFLIF